jgi:hypothetical protein
MACNAQLARDVAGASGRSAARDARDDRRWAQVNEHVPLLAKDDGIAAVEPLLSADGDGCLERCQATSRSFSLSASARSFFRPWFSI